MSSNRTVAWVKYAPQPVLANVLRLTPSAELAHRRFCDHVWSEGRWPETKATGMMLLARVPAGEWPAILKELRGVGWRQKGRHLVNPAVGRVRREALQFRAAAVARGRLGGRPPQQNGACPSSPEQVESNPRATQEGVKSKLRATQEQPNLVQDKVSTVTGTDIALTNDERLTRIVSAPKGGRNKAEKAFLEDVRQTLGLLSAKAADSEITNWGGWWRNRFRENAEKAARVLAEVRSMIREHRVLSNPGAAAVDLWSRLP